MIVGITNGCFDLLHLGHLTLLTECAKRCDVLYVGVNDDKSISLLKGPTRPIQDAQTRCAVVGALRCVYQAFIFEGPSFADSLRAYRADTWFKGADYSMETLNPAEVEAAKIAGTGISFIPLVEGVSTSKIISKIKK